MRLTVSLSEIESVPMHPGRHYLKSLSGDPAVYKDTHTLRNRACKLRKQAFRCRLKPKFKLYLIGGRTSFSL